MSEQEAAVEAAAEDGRDFVTAEDVEQASAPERPEWLPEKYKTGEDLAKAYKELESKLGSKDEEIRQSIIEEIQAEAFSDRPETAGDYVLPDIIDQESGLDNELLRWWSEHSFENGFSQQEFEQGIEMYAQAMNADMPDLEAEEAKLGDNANARIEAASLFAHNMFSEEQLPAIERLFESAEGVMVMETIMDAMKDSSINQSPASVADNNEAELREMMKDPRYWNPSDRDPNFIKQVENGFKRIYGG